MNINNPIHIQNIFKFPNYDKVCWGEIGYESTGPQSSKPVIKKYLGKYLSHTVNYVNRPFGQGQDKFPTIKFEHGGVTPGTEKYATIFTLECQSGGRHRNRRTKKKARRNRHHSSKRN